jgi:hypothetical protein
LEREVTFRIPFGTLPGLGSGILLTPLLYMKKKPETHSEKEYKNVPRGVCLIGLQNLLMCHNIINTTVPIAHVIVYTAMKNEGSLKYA